MTNKHGVSALQRLINATRYSLAGLKAAWQHEAAFRLEIYLIVLAAPLAFFVGKTKIEIVLLLLPLFVMLIAELINSAIEAVVDRFGGEHHELSGRAKDLGSAAVFVSALTTAATWSIIILY